MKTGTNCLKFANKSIYRMYKQSDKYIHQPKIRQKTFKVYVY